MSQSEDETTEEGTSSPDHTWWRKHVWEPEIQPKTRVFMWRAMHDFIPTMANRKEHHVLTDGVCTFCRSRWATTEHTLIFCPEVRKFWKRSRFWQGMKNGDMAKMKDIAGAIRKNHSKEEYEVWCTMLWQVWTYVCSKLHDSDVNMLPSEARSRMASETYKGVRKATGANRPLEALCGNKKWTRPRRGCHRVDVDVLFNKDRQEYGVGVIIRDWRGSVVAAKSRITPPRTNVMVAEMMAIIEGITFSLECQVPLIEIYTDSLLSARIMEKEDEAGELLPEDIMEMIEIARANMLVGVHHMYREANRAAHSLAQYVKVSNSDSTWVEDFPTWLMDIVKEDLME